MTIRVRRPLSVLARLTLTLTAMIGCLTATAQARTVLRRVNVVPMDVEIVLSSRDVVIEDDHIVDIVPGGTAALRKGDRQIDGRGKFLIPGLVDFHTHPESPNEAVLYLRQGITMIAAMGGEELDWRNNAMISRPYPTVIGGTKAIQGRGPGQYVVSLENAGRVVGHAAISGAEFVKIYTATPTNTFLALSKAARTLGLPVIGHVPEGVPPTIALPGLDLVAHSEELTRYLDGRSSGDEVAALAAMFLKSRTWLSPNLVVIDKIDEHALDPAGVVREGNILDVSPAIYQNWLPRNNSYAARQNPTRFVEAIRKQLALQKSWVRQLHEAGVPMLLGTDTPTTCVPGRCVHDELSLLLESGLSNYQALRTATYNPGIFLAEKRRNRTGRRTGIIAPGARADLVLLDGNPLKDLTALRDPWAVIAGGSFHARRALEKAARRMRAENARAHRFVDKYERMVGEGRIEELAKVLRDTRRAAGPMLNVWVVYGDVQDLLSTQRNSEARLLWQAATPLLYDTMTRRNLSGRLFLQLGDHKNAASEFRRSLSIAPLNEVALDGLPEAEGVRSDGQRAHLDR